MRTLGPTRLPLEFAGERLDRAMARALSISRGEARRIIDAGGAWLGGRRCKVASRRCEPGDELVAYVADRASTPDPVVVWTDGQLAVVDKPAGMASTPTRESDVDNVDAWARGRFGRRIHLPHRLDRGASGLMLVVLDPGLNRAVTEAFRRATIKRTYRVRTLGSPAHAEQRLVGTLDGKAAALRYRRLGGDELEVHLETGRTHQIRRQLSEIGCPVLGDTRYGGPPGPLALRAVALSLEHPGTGEALSFEVLEPGGSQ